MATKSGRAAAAREQDVCAECGPGAWCAEAQADGVPCSEIRDCAKCGRAVLQPSAPAVVMPLLH